MPVPELSPRWRKVARDLWIHRARTVIVVLAIAIGIVGAGSVLATWAIVRDVVDRGYVASTPASGTITVDAVTPALLAVLRADPALGSVAAGRTVAARARGAGGWIGVRLFAREDLADGRIGRLRLEAGEWPVADDAIVIERSSLDLAPAGVGESLFVAVGEGAPVPLRVSGVARDVGLAPGWMEHVVYAFVTPAALARLGAGGHLDEIRFVTRDPALARDSIRRVASGLVAAIASSGGRVRDVDVPVPGKHIHADQMNSLLYTQAGFGILALILSALLALNLVEAMLAGQVREIAVMKAVGARPAQVAAMYLGVAGIMGVMASAIAIPASAAIGKAYAGFTAGMLNFDASTASVPVWVIVVQLAVGAVLPMLAAAVPVWRGSRLSVSAALRDFGVSARPEGTGWLTRLGGVSRPVLLSVRNAFRRRGRMARTLLTLAMGGAVFLGALNLKAGIRSAMDRTFDAMAYDLTLGIAPGVPVDSLEAALARVPGVRGAEAWSAASGVLVGAEGTWGSSLGLTGVPVGTRLVAIQPTSGRWLADGASREMVVSARQAEDEPALALGNTVTLRIGEVTSEWTIVGIAAGVLGSAWVSREALAAVTGDPGATRAAVDFAEDDVAAQATTRERVHAALSATPTQWGLTPLVGGLRVTSSRVADTRASIEDHLLMVAEFLSVMGWLMLVVGGLALASTMSLAVLERTREIGVLRAIGARHGAIHLVVQGEGLAVAVASWALAIPLSAPMGIVLGNAFGRIFFKTPVAIAPQWSGVAVWLGVVVVVSLLACAWPAVRATRVSARTALAYE